MKNFFIISTLVFLNACATDTLNKGLPLLQGQHVDTAIKYIGLPDTEQVIAGRKVYIWGHQNSGSYLMPVTTPTSYTAYSPYGGAYTATGTSTSYVTQNYDYNCTIKMVANKKNIIQSSEYEGNEGGCEFFADGIERLINDISVQSPTSKEIAKKENNKKK